MPTLVVQPLQRSIALAPDETVLQALQRSGIAIEADCGGQGLCGKCTVLVEDPSGIPPTPHPRIPVGDEARGVRLACRIQPEQDLTVRVVPSAPEDDADASQWILGGDRIELDAVRPAAGRIRSGARPGVVLKNGDRQDQLSWPAERPLLGAALDVGTTTLACSVFDLESGLARASVTGLNPQRAYGADVLSRIQHASTPKGLEELCASIRGKCNALLEAACSRAGTSTEALLDLVLGGNTTMLQILAGIDPAPLGRSPFRVSLEGGRRYPAGDFGLRVHFRAGVYVPPLLHAYAGADISAGLLAVDFFAGRAPVVLIDIGTNGELALRTPERQLAASTAAGPAFEGGGLQSGMGAATGAIEQAWLDRGRLRVSTLGNAEPRGICGSGLVDLVACLLRLGLLAPSGRLLRPGEAPALPEGSLGQPVQAGDVAAVQLAEGVSLTQQDIRAFQLAKSAVRTGLDLLLDKAGVEAARLERLILAGGFGRSLRPLNLEAVGMLPPGAAAKLVFGGNTSLAGASRLLLDVQQRARLETAADGLEYVDLAGEEAFQDLFVQNMGFPEPARCRGAARSIPAGA